MKICEAIRQTDELKPNQYSDEQKIMWLSELDGKIVKELIDAKSGEKSTVFEGYNEDTDTNTELLVPEPYSNLYVLWLMSKLTFQRRIRPIQQFGNGFQRGIRGLLGILQQNARGSGGRNIYEVN